MRFGIRSCVSPKILGVVQEKYDKNHLKTFTAAFMVNWCSNFKALVSVL